MSDDGFEDIFKEGPAKNPCTVVCSEMGRQKAKRLSITFRADLLDPDVRKVLLENNHFSVAYNASARTIRVKADLRGQYEMVHAPRTETVRILRFAFPKQGVEWCTQRTPAEVDVNLEQGAIFIDLPRVFHPKPKALQLAPPAKHKVPVLPSPMRLDVTASLMGDPPPGRSAVPIRHEGYEDDKRMQKLLGLTRNFPLSLSGTRFAPAEAAIMEVLYKRPQVNRTGLMVATHDPEKGEDERDSKIVDVYLSRLRTKLKPIGLDILSEWGGDRFWLSPEYKAKLKGLLADEGYGVEAA